MFFKLFGTIYMKQYTYNTESQRNVCIEYGKEFFNNWDILNVTFNIFYIHMKSSIFCSSILKLP